MGEVRRWRNILLGMVFLATANVNLNTMLCPRITLSSNLLTLRKGRQTGVHWLQDQEPLVLGLATTRGSILEEGPFDLQP